MINNKNLGIQKNFNHKKFLEKAIQLHKKGEIKKAISIYLKLIKKNKNNIQLLSLIGIANLQIEKNIVGIEYLKKVLELKPNDVSALINIGNGYKNLREHYEAIKYYNKAININHDNADAYSNKGAILLQIKKFEEAIINLNNAIKIKPDHFFAYTNLGIAQKNLSRFKEAIFSFDIAIKINKDFADAYNNRGDVFSDLNLNEKALEDYEKVLKLNPNFDYILGKVLHYKMILCDWNNFNLISEKILNKINNGYNATAPFWLLSISDSLKYTKLSSKIYSENNFSVKINNKPLFKYNNKKPKIAYFSADFYNHATLHLMMDVFKNHDKSKFDIFGFSFGLDKNDEWKKEVKNYFLQFKEIGNISDSDVINLVRDLKIDIAVDLKGFTTNNRSSIFSNRIAPIQINYLGYPGTTAIQNMDYIIADELIIPKKNFRYFSEKVIHLPNCYQPNMHKRDISNKKFTRNEFGLPENGFVYCSFNNNNKITPDIFDTWMNILKEVKNSVLWILRSNEAVVKNLKKEAKKKGVNSNRIIFANYLPNNEHLKRLSLANLFLDTFPCNAHTTASDAIRIRLPLITLMGNSFASRVAASLLKNLEMEELITFNLKDYEKLAIDFGLNSNKFQQIKKSFEKAVSKSSLFDSNKFTLNLENLYLKLLDN